MNSTTNATHIYRELTPGGYVYHRGIFVQELGFLLLTAKHIRPDTEVGLYRLLKNLNVMDVFTLAEATQQGWIPQRPVLLDRETRMKKTMIA